MAIFFNRLSREYDRERFDCGTPELNDYLQKYALQDEKRDLARVFVLVEDHRHIVGFFTLSQYAADLRSLPEQMKKRLPGYRVVPCSLLGRLAVSVDYKGRGYGRDLLYYAMKQAKVVNRDIASIGLVVDAKNQDAKAFYKKFGFFTFADDEMRLILPMKEIPIFMDLWEKEDRKQGASI